MEIQYKLLSPSAKVPKQATDGSAAFDLSCVSMRFDGTKDRPYIEYDTGVAFFMPKYVVGVLAARSSVSNKGLWLANSIGIIDSDYTGPIKVRFYYDNNSSIYMIGERIAQIMFLELPQINLKETNIIPFTKRGDGGFGSTDE